MDPLICCGLRRESSTNLRSFLVPHRRGDLVIGMFQWIRAWRQGGQRDYSLQILILKRGSIWNGFEL